MISAVLTKQEALGVNSCMTHTVQLYLALIQLDPALMLT